MYNTAVKFVPTFCHENLAVLTLNVRGSPVDLCNCRNAWMKQAEESGANIFVDDMACSGNMWKVMTLKELLDVCIDSGNSNSKLSFS